MLSIEQSLLQYAPWLAHHPRLRRPVANLLGRLADEANFNQVLADLDGLSGFEFVERTLEHRHASYRVTPRELEHIPAEGAVLIVANHPLGMIDAIALLHLVGRVRRDVRVLGNDVLDMLPQLSELLLPVDVFGSGASSRMRAVFRALGEGKALVMFPSGEVSRMRPNGVRDGRWLDGFARLSMRTDTPVVPVHIGARNSAMFYGVSMLAKPLATAMLPREAISGRTTSIRMRVGARIDAEEIRQRSAGQSRQAARLMRRHVYRLAHHRGLIFGGQASLAHPEPVDAVEAELQQRGQKLADVGKGQQAWLFPGAADGVVMRELGRLRELTFRKVGEGTGLRCDLDVYDARYEHLVLWDANARRIAGAYRLGHGGRILEQHGLPGLYSASLFNYTPALTAQLTAGLELGRSFIAPAYWRSRALDHLWRGIGLYLQQHPQIRYLFGPVSLSVSLPREAREWIVAAHQHYFGAPGLASARRPFQVSSLVLDGVRAELNGLDPIAGLGHLRHRLDALGVTLPVLYRQYVDLVEPDGVQFLDFGEDPEFSGCVDGMVLLDLARLKPAKRMRYLDRN